MHQLMFEAAGEYAWRDAPDPEITAPGQAIVRPVAVACCDLDVAVAEGRLPMPPGPAVGHEGGAEGQAAGGAGAETWGGWRPFAIARSGVGWSFRSRSAAECALPACGARRGRVLRCH